jgi:acyl carrier protein
MNIPIEKISEKTSQENVENWDSIKHMALVLSLEEELGIRFLNHEIIEMTSVENIVRIMKRHKQSSPR